MEELQELIIYRGYKTILDASIGELDAETQNIGALAYSKSLGKKYIATSVPIDEENMQFVFPSELTALMDAGKYDLEFYNGDKLYEVRKNFITVMKASPADGEVIVVPDEDESSAS